MPMKGGYRDYVLCLIVIIGLVILARPTWYLLQRNYVGHCAKKTWDQELRASGVSREVGQPVAWLKISDANLDTLVLGGATKSNLSRFPSMEASFSDPGALGLTVILGHRDSHFKNLDRLKEGGDVKVQDLSGRWIQYSVSKTQVVDKNDVGGLLEGKEGLLLMTCYPLVYVGEAPQRYLVWAKANLKKELTI